MLHRSRSDKPAINEAPICRDKTVVAVQETSQDQSHGKLGGTQSWVCGRKDGARKRFGRCTFHAHAVTECLDKHVFKKEFGLSGPGSADASRQKSRLASVGIPHEGQRKERKLLRSQLANGPVNCGDVFPPDRPHPSLPSATLYTCRNVRDSAGHVRLVATSQGWMLKARHEI